MSQKVGKKTDGGNVPVATCYDTNSLRLITPRLCTYNVNVNRPYTHMVNINRMFMVDMTYMPGYFIEEYPHRYYKNRAASWSPGNRLNALPPGLTRAGLEEKHQLQDYIRERQRLSSGKNNTRSQYIGNQQIRVNPPSLGLLKQLYKRPLAMYDLDDEDTARCKDMPDKNQSEAQSYSIFPALQESASDQRPAILAATVNDVIKPVQQKSRYKCTAGKKWNMDRFKMWSGGTEGSVEFPKWSTPCNGKPMRETSVSHHRTMDHWH